MTLSGEKDEVVGMVCAEDINTQILVVSEKGFGKRSEIEEYRVTNRGGKGVKTINITEKTGALISILGVKSEEDLMIITRSGVAIRTPIEDLRVMGRNTQGVKLINLKGSESIAAVTRVDKEDEEPEVIEGGEITGGTEGADGEENPNTETENP